jgi:cyanophycinase
MRRARVCFLFLLMVCGAAAFAAPRGYLFIIGGGDRPESMMRRFVDLARRFGSGKIVVFPMASAEPKATGDGLVEEFKKLGAPDAVNSVLSRDQALEEGSARILDGAGGVFFSGGDQSRQMAVLLHTPIHRRLVELYEKGCVMGGTSAGAAVMSEVMITGDEKRKVKEGHEFETIEAENIVTKEGLGFLKTAIIDQHFVARKRLNRLISLVAEKPALLGIGVDESTAIIVEPGQSFEVIGAGSVLVLDGSRAPVRIAPNRRIGFTGMLFHSLLPGDRFDLVNRKAVP